MKKKYFCIAFCFILVSAGLSIHAEAATLADIAGIYNVEIQAKFKIKKLGSDKVFDSGMLTLDAGGTFILHQDGSPYDVDGSIFLDSKGKKIFFDLSPTGTDALKDALTDWIVSAAAVEGVPISNVDFTFSIIKTSKVKIDKKTSRAKGKAKLKVKGTFSADLFGIPWQSNFSYQAKIKILP